MIEQRVASSVTNTPISPDTHLLEVLHHITANQSLAGKPSLQTGSSGSDLLQYKSAFSNLQQDNGGADKLNTA